MEFPPPSSMTDIKMSISTLSSRSQAFPVLPESENNILAQEPNSQNQVNIPHRRSRSLSPTHRSSCPPSVYTWRRTSGIHKCHSQEFHHPFQKLEGENSTGLFPRLPFGDSEDLFTRPGYGIPGACSRARSDFILPCGRTVRLFTKADPNLWLAIRDGSVVLASANPIDEFQQWVMDETYSIVKDKAQRPSFSLVNKATGQALKHGLGETQPVLLTRYEPNKFDESIPWPLYEPEKFDDSILWTTSGDMGQAFRAIRLVNNMHLNLNAFHGDKKSGGIKDGNPVVLWSWKKGDNQLWKIVPF